MPAKPRPPMPKLPPFALANARPPRKAQPWHLLIFFFLFAIPLFVIHLQLISLPFFWDELGQFVPSALDLLRSGAWVPHSAVPNVHPPGVPAYLALWYKLFGFSIPVTRVAMLVAAAGGLLVSFLLAIELSHGTAGAPAFFPPLLLLASPLFFTQSMMAQLDMPAMTLTLLALLLFVKRTYIWAMAACVALVLVKETGVAVPFVFFVFLWCRNERKRAALFVVPAAALGAWLIILHAKTGFWLGDPAFARYNVDYAMNPVRMVFSFLRRIFYLFFAEFRWIGTLIVLFAIGKCKAFRTPAWAVTAIVAALTTLLVSILGGAELERYLLPVLPVFYIAVSVGLTSLRKPFVIIGTTALLIGLAVSVVWNPPYPFPFENNYAMVDFVHLQQTAATFAEQSLRDRKIATAWPYTAALANPDFGYVEHKLGTVETKDLHYSSIRAIPAASFDTLIAYTREWAPNNGVTSIPFVQRFLRRFYQWDDDINRAQCAELGLREKISWSLDGQTITVYYRNRDATLEGSSIATALVPHAQ